MSRQRGRQLQGFGCVLIVTVMLIDHFLFTLQDGFLLTCAILSAAALIVGIRVVKRADDREAEELLGRPCFESLRGHRSGIRFGGRFGDQKLFSFENVSYLEQDRSMKAGVGVIPSEDRDAPLVKVVVPMC